MLSARSSVRPLAVALLALALVGVASCSSTKSVSLKGTTTTAPKATGAASPCGGKAAPPTQYKHVVLVLEENRTWTGGDSPAVGMGFSPKNMPYLHKLATQCSYFPKWNETNAGQNSLNQYVGLMSGVDNPSTVNDCSPSETCHSTDNNLFRQIRDAGGAPLSFVDGATAPCSADGNAAKHIPALYFWGANDRSACNAEVRPLSEFNPDHLPTLAFITPNLCNDGHDCSDANVDNFARATLTPILNGTDYLNGDTLVVVVYDEDRPVPNLLIARSAKAGAVTAVVGSHAGLLKTIEQALGLPVMQQGQLPTAVSLRAAAHI